MIINFFFFLNIILNWNYFEYAVKNIPNDLKIKKGGEDGYYCDNNILVITDGVSAWNNLNIDSGLWSKEFAYNFGKFYDFKKSSYENIKIAHDKTKKIGTSTLIFAYLNQDVPKLNLGNIGDSTAILLRFNNKYNEYYIHLKTYENQYKFNFPVQFGYDENRKKIWNKKDLINNDVLIEKNDILLLGSDGIYDNIYEKDILEIVNNNILFNKDDINNINKINDKIMNKSYENSINKEYFSPFYAKLYFDKKNWQFIL